MRAEGTGPAERNGGEDAGNRGDGWSPRGPRVPLSSVARAVESALAEDLGWGDATTESLIPEESVGAASVVSRGRGVVAGLPVAATVFAMVDDDVEVTLHARDGDPVAAGSLVASVRGPARALLMAERVALNFLQRLSGVATLTRRYVDAVEGTGVRIVDTRKTTPGLRVLEKYAVRCGGGHNHRFHLSDAVLVKDNHRAVLHAAAVDLADALADVRRRLPHTVSIAVELDDLEALEAALNAGVDAVLLDNMDAASLRAAVGRIRGRALVEASGGITLETVREKAETGVDLISVGALTHSAPALDMAMEWDRPRGATNGG